MRRMFVNFFVTALFSLWDKVESQSWCAEQLLAGFVCFGVCSSVGWLSHFSDLSSAHVIWWELHDHCSHPKISHFPCYLTSPRGALTEQEVTSLLRCHIECVFRLGVATVCILCWCLLAVQSKNSTALRNRSIGSPVWVIHPRVWRLIKWQNTAQ